MRCANSIKRRRDIQATRRNTIETSPYGHLNHGPSNASLDFQSQWQSGSTCNIAGLGKSNATTTKDTEALAVMTFRQTKKLFPISIFLLRECL